MPILNVKVSGNRSDDLTRAITDLLTELTASILGKNPAVTAIAIDYVDPRDWFAGGKSLAEQGQKSVYFDVKITDGTNTKDEKARYVSAAFDGLSKLLGTLHEESYIYVQDVRAEAYGYGGRTQEWRYHHPAG
ncbi:4-oxalocrotonate tautomerase [Mesorhizobium sp. NBSH29]|uniref:tautomerase family protein n=1 Tax=Mesorhizobium sp. NBSH29 TaxID=2654249 RepID=UPI001896815D|nr:4-oxalocrotonate tautomerase family protein [Mesorhizobium sp. NBSH29]QPC87744.1 4-oxalocrotonate tautomerase [Mesorhizobium sp. NBSH29]